MARPIKKGLDYYPKNINFYEDRKIRKLLKEFGSKGVLVYDYLLCLIYRDNGYYVEYDGELAFDIADYLGCGLTEGLVKEIVKGCVRVGLFDKRLHDMSNILTSSGIQKRYSLIKRNSIIDERMRVIDEKMGVIADETHINAAESTQRKEKKRKEKEKEPESSLMKDFTLEVCEHEKGSDEFKVIEAAINLYKGFCIELPNNRDLPFVEKKDWIPYVRDLMQKKGYEYWQIKEVFRFAVKDKFWSSNILTMKDLAEKFEKVKSKMQKAKQHE